jgi:hypothetical protein
VGVPRCGEVGERCGGVVEGAKLLLRCGESCVEMGGLIVRWLDCWEVPMKCFSVGAVVPPTMVNTTKPNLPFHIVFVN